MSKLGFAHGSLLAAHCSSLIHLLRLGDALIDRLTSGEYLLDSVPVGDRFFSELPAEQNDLSLDFAGKIEQSDIQVFHLYADGIDFGESIFGALLCLGAFGLTARKRHDIEKHSAVEKDAVLQSLLLGIDFVDNLLGVDGRAQQRFQHG